MLDARITLEADSHSQRVTFFGARPIAEAQYDFPVQPRIGIVGPGAMGCLLGGLLALSGVEVWMLCRRPEQADRIARQGLVVEEVGSERRAAVQATADPRQAAPLDLLIVMVKAYATEEAARAACPALGRSSWVLTLQNGLGNAEALVRVLGSDRVLAGVSSQGATLLAPGRVHHAGFGPTTVTDLRGGATERARWVASLLSRASVPTEVAPDLAPILWSKLVANTAINPLTALTGRRNGELLEGPVAQLLEGLALETATVARAAGVTLPFEDPAEHVRAIARATSANRSSMLQDVEAGRQTEIGALNEAVVAAGRRLGLPTPLNAAVSTLIHALAPPSAPTG
jgi:2-dehydropantoate 2-reductase